MVLSRWGQKGWGWFQAVFRVGTAMVCRRIRCGVGRNREGQGRLRGFGPERQGHPPIIKGAPWEGQVLWWGAKELEVTHVNLEVPVSWVVKVETEWAAWRQTFRFKGEVRAGRGNVGVISISMTFISVELDEITKVTGSQSVGPERGRESSIFIDFHDRLTSISFRHERRQQSRQQKSQMFPHHVSVNQTSRGITEASTTTESRDFSDPATSPYITTTSCSLTCEEAHTAQFIKYFGITGFFYNPVCFLLCT